MKKNKYPYIIAEIGANHNGDIDLAKKMIKKAQECGADAVKFQIYRGEELITRKHLEELDSGKIKLENISKWETKELNLNNIFEQVEQFAIQEKEHQILFNYAREIGIDYASTAITTDGVDFLIDQKVAFIKVASMDINNPEFISYIISKNYPTIISTGLASLGEIETIVNIIPNSYRKNVTLLHCISLYPPKDEIVNLNFITTLKKNFDIEIGYSDHTFGTAIPLASVVLGASVIEKHFTLDKNMPGWDHKVSANPNEFREICSQSKRIIKALGNGKKQITKPEYEKRLKFRRSLVYSKTLKSGHILQRDDIVFKRPGSGIEPCDINYVVGRKLKNDIEEDNLINWEDFI